MPIDGQGLEAPIIVTKPVKTTETGLGACDVLRYRVNLDNIMAVFSETSRASGNPSVAFDGVSCHNESGAELFFSPDTIGDKLHTVHVYGYRHENPNRKGELKGKVMEEVEMDITSDGEVSIVIITNEHGKVEICPNSDFIHIEKYDPESPAISMQEHVRREMVAGESIPYFVVPNGSTELSKLSAEQFKRVKALMEYCLKFIEPSLEINSQTLASLPFLDE